jgi:hypothetical protein
MPMARRRKSDVMFYPLESYPAGMPVERYQSLPLRTKLNVTDRVMRNIYRLDMY